MAKFRKKPVVIDAVQFAGPNWSDVLAWMGGKNHYYCPDALTESGPAAVISIATREGTMRADVGDWIIKGVKGEFYPCKPDIFAETYDAVE